MARSSARTRPLSPACRGRARWRARRGRVAVIAAALVGVVVTACGDDDATAGDGQVEVGHVHGLGVDPGTGDLYAGTHYGLLRLPTQGAPVVVADRVQDFMGFTVISPGHFLASGHPGHGQDGPGNLGLLESADGGQSWQTRSLAGEADFHALEAKHGQVYGYDSGTGDLMVSGDMRHWDTRAGLALADIAVSPQDPQAVLATTRSGLARSTDGGAIFHGVASAPTMLLVTWPEPDRAVGVAPDGTVYVSADGGATWQPRGHAGGAPTALTTAGTAIYIALEDRIVHSDDGGTTFRNHYVFP